MEPIHVRGNLSDSDKRMRSQGGLGQGEQQSPRDVRGCETVTGKGDSELCNEGPVLGEGREARSVTS